MSLCLAASVGAGNAVANQAVETHRVALTLVAMEQICNKTNPGLNGSVENAMASDASVDEATKAEVHKINSNPAYKSEVDYTIQSLERSGMAAMAKDMCPSYAAK